MAAPPREPAQGSREAGRPGDRDARQAYVAALARVDETASKQRKVWDLVAATQKKLADGVGAAVASPQSASSLQLSLENEKLKEARAAYIKALQGAGEKDGDVVGYVVAINGKLSVANVYPSNGLFRKMWEKQLAAVVTEAIGEKPGAAARRRCPAAGAGRSDRVPGRRREGQALRAHACRRHAPGGARRRQVALQRGARRRRQVDPPQLPGEVARNSRTQEFLDQVEGPWFAVAARQGRSLLALR